MALNELLLSSLSIFGNNHAEATLEKTARDAETAYLLNCGNKIEIVEEMPDTTRSKKTADTILTQRAKQVEQDYLLNNTNNIKIVQEKNSITADEYITKNPDVEHTSQLQNKSAIIDKLVIGVTKLPTGERSEIVFDKKTSNQEFGYSKNELTSLIEIALSIEKTLATFKEQYTTDQNGKIYSSSKIQNAIAVDATAQLGTIEPNTNKSIYQNEHNNKKDGFYKLTLEPTLNWVLENKKGDEELEIRLSAGLRGRIQSDTKTVLPNKTTAAIGLTAMASARYENKGGKVPFVFKFNSGINKLGPEANATIYQMDDFKLKVEGSAHILLETCVYTDGKITDLVHFDGRSIESAAKIGIVATYKNIEIRAGYKIASESDSMSRGEYSAETTNTHSGMYLGIQARLK